jgi:hypothetical protein
MIPAYPSVDESYNRLHRAGWSFGWAGFGSSWLVDGTNGENRIFAEGHTLDEALWRACQQARACGMLAPPDIAREGVAATVTARRLSGVKADLRLHEGCSGCHV